MCIGEKGMKVRDRVGLKFIKASIPFVSYANLFQIKHLVKDDPDSPEKKRIIEMVDMELDKRDRGYVDKEGISRYV